MSWVEGVLCIVCLFELLMLVSAHDRIARQAARINQLFDLVERMSACAEREELDKLTNNRLSTMWDK